MAECACGCGGGEGSGKKRILFACAGAANVGQLTNIAVVQLAQEGFGSHACTAQLANGDGPVKQKCAEADEIVVLDGCPATCASKIVKAQGIEADQTVVITELGIAKSPNLTLSDEEIETVVSAVWEGKGKKSQKDCGCGCPNE